VVTTLAAGDRVFVMTPGGGGYGDPRRRAASAIGHDLADGKVSAAHVATVYEGGAGTGAAADQQRLSP